MEHFLYEGPIRFCGEYPVTGNVRPKDGKQQETIQERLTQMKISMKAKYIVAFAGALSVAALFAAKGKVKEKERFAGEGTVRASSFGWNATNATGCLQAAIDSGAKQVLIDRQAGDWIVEPIFLRVSGQEVVLADGVTVRALKGGFKGRSDCLFRISGRNRNVTLRGEGAATLVMNKRDYQDASQYVDSQWRHAVSVAGSHTTVSNLTILSSGGDGVYVCGNAKDVLLERLVCRDHHRQGLSVIGAIRLRVRNCRFEDTAGTAPQCGVDIEPNRPTDRLEDVLFEDCVFGRNAADGITLHLPRLKHPISVTVRRCVSRGNRAGISVYSTRHFDPFPRGTVLFEDCSVSECRFNALRVNNQRKGGLDILFRNCSFDARGVSDAPVAFDNKTLPADFCGVAFENTRLAVGDSAKQVTFTAIDGAGIAPGGIKGDLTVEKSNGEKNIFDFAALIKRYPSNPEKLAAMLAFKTIDLDWRAVNPAADATPLAEPVSTGLLRGRFTFVQAFEKAGDYPVVFRNKREGGRNMGETKVQVRDAAGTDLGVFTVGEGETVTNVIHAVRPGMRRYEVVSRGLTEVKSRWPGNGILADFGVPVFKGKKRRYYFTVPGDAEEVCVQVRAIEPCSAQLLRPDGSVVESKAYANKEMGLLSAKRDKTAVSEVWCLAFPEIEEDARFRIGAPAVPVAATGSPDMALAIR